MTYDSRTPDPIALSGQGGLRPRTQRKLDDRNSRDEEAACKIEGFFKTRFPEAGLAHLVQGENRADKVELSKTETQLSVQHRGHRMIIDVAGMDIPVENIEIVFRTWCKNNMGHAKIFPRKN